MVNVTFQKFSTVTSITCNAALVSAGPTVTATYISGSGANISTQSEVVSNWPADFTRAKPYGQTNYLTNDAGAFEIERGFIVTPYTDAWNHSLVTQSCSMEKTTSSFLLRVQH